MSLIYYFLAYLLGSIPFGFLTAKTVKGIDIRQFGSRNIGATNVFRVVGKKWGILVFILDALKGYLAVSIPVFLTHQKDIPPALGFAVLAIAGHSFPVWLSFRGGKGVATSLGVFLAITFMPTLIAFAFWIIIFLITHIISMASLAAALLFPLIITLYHHGRPGFPWLLATSLLLAFFMFYTHRPNIGRILRGEEKRLF